MPVQSCRSDGKPGYRWGNSGACYTYAPGDESARKEARRKAIIQGSAIEARSGRAGMTGELFTALADEALADAEEQFLPELERAWQRALEQVASVASGQFALVAAADDWQPPPEGWTLTPAATAEIVISLNRSLEPLRAQIMQQVANSALARVEISWDLKAPLATHALEDAAKRTGIRLGEAVQGPLREVIAEAWAEGLSVPETTRRIELALREAAPWQAQMLARTDLNSMANGASRASAELAGMGFKTWLTAADDKVRPEHVEADGQTVPINAPFFVCGEEAQYPGDPNLSDDCAANCRCTLVYGETLEEAEGLLADAAASMMSAMATVRQRARRKTRRHTASTASPPAVDSRGGVLSAAAMTAAARPVGFDGVATIEGRVSDDNSIAPRVLLPDSLSWPELPLSFLAQTRTAEGHEGAEVAGRVDAFARHRGQGRMRMIKFAGELTNNFGVEEIAPMIADGTMRYVSADLGATEWALVDRETFAVVPEEQFDLARAQEGRYALGLTGGKLKAVTLVATQAIEGAMVALTASADEHGVGICQTGDDEYQVVVPLALELADRDALVASADEWAPPLAWFETPEPPGKMPLTVSADGRVYGHLATWDSCHMGFLPSCVPPPRSASSYAYFHVCEIDTADGETVTVGKLMFSPADGGHADRGLTAQKAAAYYDRTGMVAAVLRVCDGEHGIWACGSLNPALGLEQRKQMRRELRLHPPSGDWRPVNGQYELICGLAVAVPGFPVPRATVTITAAGDGLELEDAIILSSGRFDADETVLAALEHEGLLDDELLAERRLRTLAARAEGLDALAALAGE